MTENKGKQWADARDARTLKLINEHITSFVLSVQEPKCTTIQQQT